MQEVSIEKHFAAILSPALKTSPLSFIVEEMVPA
jgi:hypothetical protein